MQVCQERNMGEVEGEVVEAEAHLKGRNNPVRKRNIEAMKGQREVKRRNHSLQDGRHKRVEPGQQKESVQQVGDQEPGYRGA